MKVNQIKKIAIVGAGIMGHGFAMVFAQKGYPVFLYDIDPRILKKALARIAANLDTFVEPTRPISFRSWRSSAGQKLRMKLLNCVTAKAFCSLGF